MKIPLLASVVSILVSTSIAAQTPLPDSVVRGAMQRRELIWSNEQDGLWAVGRDYKAGFAAQSAEFVPFLGSDAPHNYPVKLRLESVSIGSQFLPIAAEAAWHRDGNRVTLDHGSVREFYDASEASLEQSFLVAQDCAAGLVLNLSVESELERSSDAQGLVLSNERGGVRISSAFAIGADGTRVEAPTRWTASGLSIEVPAGLHAPVTIDPVLSTFTLVNTTDDEVSPSAAWDPALQHWMFVWESDWSATDGDIWYAGINASGSGAWGGAVLPLQVGGIESRRPRLAYFAGSSRFVCANENRVPSGPDIAVLGMVDSSTGATAGFTFVGSAVDLREPVVAGNLDPASSSRGLLVYVKVTSSTQREVWACPLDSLGIPVSMPGYIVDGAPNVIDQEPVISSNAGSLPATSQAWTVVWKRAIGLFGADLYAAQFNADGSQAVPAFPIDTSADMTYMPSVSSLTDTTPRRYLVTYARGASIASDFEIWGQLMEGTTVIESQNLTALVGANSAQLQYESAVETNGHDFQFAWTETASGSTTNTDIYEATLVQTGGKLAVAGAPTVVSSNGWPEDQIALSSCRGSATTDRRSAVLYRRQGGGPNFDDIQGARLVSNPFTKFCAPGSGPTIACPCGNAPTGALRGCNNSSNSGGGQLDASGDPDADSVVLLASSMRPNATCVFLQGATSNATGVSFGDGVRCAAGQLLRLSVKTTSASSTSSFPVGADPSIKTRCQTLGAPISAGQTRAYQVYYRDPASFGCASPATFNITAALQVQW